MRNNFYESGVYKIDDFVSLIYATLIIILICYRNHAAKNETQNRIVLNEDIQGYGYSREKDKSLNLNYKPRKNEDLNQQNNSLEEDKFES